MLKSATICIGILSVVALISAATGAGRAQGREIQGAASYQQTRDGVTVRIEKIARERVFNSVGWFRQQDGPDWQRFAPPGFEPKPFQVVRVFVSVTRDEAKADQIKGWSGSLELAKVRPAAPSEWRPRGSAYFDPPLWQRQLPEIEIDPDAKGALFLKVVERNANAEELFPAELRFEVTTGQGKQLEFLFSDLEV